jgi:predicted RNA-binding protein with RPS1 domain
MPMPAPGDILEVVVEHVAVFGLFCRAEEQEVLVRIPETSWVASYCSCEQFAAVGDRFRVQVLHVNTERNQISASIRVMYPDSWHTGQLAEGTIHEARVMRAIDKSDRCNHGPAYLLELLPGTYVVLGGTSPRLIGSTCRVKIVEADFKRQAVRVELVD